MSPRQRGRPARRPNRSRFQPEPIPAATPTSTRGYIEAAPQPDHPGQFRVWLHGDGHPDSPSSVLLTNQDIRRLCWFLHRLTESPQVAEGARLVSTQDRAILVPSQDRAPSSDAVANLGRSDNTACN